MIISEKHKKRIVSLEYMCGLPVKEVNMEALGDYFKELNVDGYPFTYVRICPSKYLKALDIENCLIPTVNESVWRFDLEMFVTFAFNFESTYTLILRYGFVQKFFIPISLPLEARPFRD